MSLPELLNSNQILHGARTQGGSKTYASVIVSTPVTTVAATNYDLVANDTAAASTITLTEGVLEVEGKNYAVGSDASLAAASLNLYNVKNLLIAGQRYRLEAVPAYVTPLDQSTAEAAGLNYFVQDGAYASMNLFIKQSVIDLVLSYGGLVELEQIVFSGAATVAQKSAYYAYKEAESDYLDLRYNTAAPLPVAGYRFILNQVIPTIAQGGSDVLANLSQRDALELINSIEFIYSKKLVYDNATNTGSEKAQAAYGTKLYLVDKAYGYATLADQTNDVNRIPVDKANSFKATTGGANVAFVNVYYYALPGYLGRSNYARTSVDKRYLTRKESLYLGRVDPIYLGNSNDGPKFARGKLSRLTNWANPQPVVEFTATPAVTTGSAATSTPYFSATNLVNLTL